MEAVARIWNVDMSPKYSRELAVEIRGMTLEQARRRINEIIEMKRPLVLRRHNKEVPHHYGRPSRYPVKVAKNFLKLLDNAEANAEYKGADPEKLRIVKIEVYRSYPKRSPGSKPLGRAKIRGRRTSVMVVVEDGEK